ncbi:hypothetical protein ACX0G7_03195 [Flavitalea antarctica]
MKGKIIITLTVLITLAMSSADAQSVREKRQYQRDRISKSYERGKISKQDRQRIARERHHYVHGKYYGRNERRYGYREKRYQRYDNRRNTRYGYNYRNGLRRFD